MASLLILAVPSVAETCDALNMFALHLLAQASNGGAAGFALGGGVLMIVFILIAVLASIFWLWMLVDCLTSNLPVTEKLLWFLVIFFLHLLGAILYFAIRRSGRARLAG